MREPDAGFSVLELTIAMAVMLTITGAVVALLNPSRGAFSVEPEVADMQQRLRVAEDTLARDLLMAGGGAYHGSASGPLTFFFAPVLPYRVGVRLQDPPGSFKADAITVMYVPAASSQTSISQPIPDTSAVLKVADEPGCPLDSSGVPQNLCGLADGTTVVVYDGTGAYDTFVVSGVRPSAGLLQHNASGLSKAYDTGATVVQVASHTYYVRADDRAGTYQLMHYDGSSNADMPVVDHIVGLSFEYYGDPLPPAVRKPLSEPVGPWTTYGPAPRIASPPYPAGENCVFIDPGTPMPAPRLANLTKGGNPLALVRLSRDELADGPWCPSDTSPGKWDADLLRIRTIAVTVRVQAAIAALRGPAGALFAHGGTSQSGTRYAPDQELRFEVTPRNMNLGR